MRNLWLVGIDPGVRQTGVAVLLGTSLYAAKTFVGGPEDVTADLAMWVHEQVTRTAVGIEDQRYVQRGKASRNQTNFAASALRDMQWALYGAFTAYEYPVFFIAPQTAKKALVNGRATKTQMTALARARFGALVTSEHIADAVAVAAATTPRYQRWLKEPKE